MSKPKQTPERDVPRFTVSPKKGGTIHIKPKGKKPASKPESK